VTTDAGGTSSTGPVSGEDVDQLAWLLRYAPVIVATVALGLAAGIAIGIVERRPIEAWTYVIQTGARIPTRQLAPLAEAVFTSSALYAPAMEALSDREAPATFLKRVELRPVPGTPMLIVIGRASTESGAERISSVTARALIGAFAKAGFPEFSILGLGPPVVRSALSPLVLSTLGAAVGLWLGMAVALLHHRVRRPRLSVRTGDPSHPPSGTSEWS
jgi:hypothetical protein